MGYGWVRVSDETRVWGGIRKWIMFGTGDGFEVWDGVGIWGWLGLIEVAGTDNIISCHALIITLQYNV